MSTDGGELVTTERPATRPSACTRYARLRHTLRHHLRGARLVAHRGREDRAGDRQTDRAADLLEERQVAGGGTEACDRHAVLDDEGEDRERGSDADAGDEHPRPQRSGSACRRAGCSAARGPPPSDQRAEDEPAVAPRARHDLTGRDRADDEAAEQGQDLVPRFGRRGTFTTWNQRGRKTTVAKKPNAARKMAVDRHGEGADPEDAQRHDRLRHA